MRALVVLAVALGGSIGAPARLLVDRVVADRTSSDFPLGTLLVNLSGSFLLGLMTGLGLAEHPSPFVEALLGTGFCGAYTTFSTWSYETVRLLEEREVLAALTNTFSSLAFGLFAGGAGIAVGLLS